MVLPLVVAAIGCGHEDRSAAECRAGFDRAQWLAPTASTTTPTTRQRLADELLACDALTGLTRAEVRGLLGRPDLVHARVWEYGTGPQRVMPIDSELLDITFAAGVVTKAELTND